MVRYVIEGIESSGKRVGIGANDSARAALRIWTAGEQLYINRVISDGVAEISIAELRRRAKDEA